MGIKTLHELHVREFDGGVQQLMCSFDFVLLRSLRQDAFTPADSYGQIHTRRLNDGLTAPDLKDDEGARPNMPGTHGLIF